MGLKILACEEHPEAGLNVTVCADTLAQSITFDADGYLPEDDFFHLAPGEARTVRLVPLPDVQPAARIGLQALNSWSAATIEVWR